MGLRKREIEDCRMREKTCKNKECKKKFQPTKPMQTTCDYLCAIKYAEQRQDKREKDSKKKARKALKQFNDSDIAVLKRRAQKICNEYIRLRDKHLPCISCSYEGNERQWHAGHYKPQGGFSGLRFDERNIHKQCSICNNHLSGNLVKYRVNLVKKVGQETVDFLETGTHLKKWSKEELDAIIDYYKPKVKKLKEQCANT